MKDISDIVDKLSSTEKASLYEILFGKLRGNQGSALIQAFQSGQIEKAYKTATTSSGSAMAEQEKWMDSLEAKTQQLQASLEGLSQTFLDDNFLKGLVDSGTTALDILTKIINSIGSLNTVLAGVGIASFIKNFD
jgi:TP901 family phage tail tape measure protein